MPKFQRDNRGRCEIQTRNSTRIAETADEDSLTIEAVLSTEQPVRMFCWSSDRVVMEVLTADGRSEAAHVPMLDSHSRYSVADNLGHVEEIRTEGSDTVGRLHFDSGMDLARDAFRKYQNGSLVSVSVGYRILSYETIPPGETRTINGRQWVADAQSALRVVTSWELHEVSAVNIPADNLANVRGDESGITASEITEQQADALIAQRTKPQETQDSDRSESTTKPADTGERNEEMPQQSTPAEDSARSEDQIRQEAVKAERDRVKQIKEIGGDDVRSETVQKAIEDGLTAEQFRSVALDDIRAQRTVTPPVSADIPNIQIDSDKRHARDVNKRSVAISLAMRLGAKNPERHIARVNHDESTGETIFEPSDYRALEEERKEIERDMERAYSLRRMHQCDVAGELCRMAEIEKPFERRSMVTRAMGTPEASAIYTSATGAALVEFMGQVMDSTQGWVQEREANSFKSQELVKLEGGKLKRRPRGKKAEIAEFSDQVESYKVYEFARTLLIDRQDLVDDEIGAWATAVDEFARAIAAVRPDLVYSVLMQNAALSDGVALFDAASHGNLLAGTLGQATLQALMTAVSQQKNAGGIPLNLEAKYLIVGSSDQFKGLQLANSSETRGAGEEDGTMNPLQSKGLQVHHESRLSVGFNDPITGEAIAPATGHFYCAADRGAYGLVYGTLSGTNGMPTISTTVKNSDGVYGLCLDVAHVGGCGASDYRGLGRSN